MNPKPMAFMSYANLDDEHGEGWITEFRQRLSKAVSLHIGEQFEIFQDRESVKLGQNWQERIDSSLEATTFLIAMITPRFFRSACCRDELGKFLERERRLGRSDLVVPIYYVNVPFLHDERARSQDPLAQAVMARQFEDWRELQLEPLDSKKVRKTLVKMARQIAEVVEQLKEIPPEFVKPILSVEVGTPADLVEAHEKPEAALRPQDGLTSGLVSVSAKASAIEPWASEQGQDEFGRWAAFHCGRVRHVMRWIEPGRFLMGSPKDEPERCDDEIQHEVVLSEGFWLGETTCTQQLWQEVVGTSPSHFKGPLRPVEQASWDDVQDFLERLNRRVPSLGACLPTEAQWEYACRAGTTTPFSFGTTVSTDRANFNGNFPCAGGAKGIFRGETVDVRALPCNSWGLRQMHGNVWEWCRDFYGPYVGSTAVDPVVPASGGDSVVSGGSWFRQMHGSIWEWCQDLYEFYAYSTAVDPLGAATGSVRVVRGGSWISIGGLCRSALRSRYEPAYRDRNVGFRLARGRTV